MVTLDARAVEIEDVTFVVVTLQGGPVRTRVTLANRLDGPVWPPRRAGHPEDGWNEDGYEGVVPADEQVALGYACPAAPAEQPVEIVATERAEEPAGEFESATSVLRGLGSPAPPREAVPLPAGGERDGRRQRPSTITGPDGDDHAEVLGEIDNSDGQNAVTLTDNDDRPQECEPAAATDVPESVAAWLDRVEAGIEQAEALASADDVPSATEALRQVGSLDDAVALEERRHTDRDRLRELTKRANALADRADRAAIPVDRLERLA